ncbi:hypothetical protein ACLOJK_008904 [Asimina triloba]
MNGTADNHSPHTQAGNWRDAVPRANQILPRLLVVGFPNSGGNSMNPIMERCEIVSPLGIRWISHSIHPASIATGSQPAVGRDECSIENTEQKKEASPEQCDVAVEDLSIVRAKAKAKQLQESQKAAMSVEKKFQPMLLDVWPALRTVASMSREDWVKKLHHLKGEFLSTLHHYRLGMKLLWADVRISSRLLLKLGVGKSLSRRERKQLTRTTADIFRLVPFAVFVIVPFMELLLPVFLKLFPNMLPSTFQDKMKEQEALKRRLKVRIEYAKFLQDTVEEMAKEIQFSHSGETEKTSEDLNEFLYKVRTGAHVSNDEILCFAKLFDDELTLDNISRPRIKNDDKMIQAEGVKSLSEDELQQACRDRGKLGLISVEEMSQELLEWLDLSLNHSVPPSLLILSSAFNVSGKTTPEVVQATLSSLPDEVVETVGVTALPSENPVSDRRRKLEFLKMQEELIKKEEMKKGQEKQIHMKESGVDQEDLCLKETIISTAGKQEMATAKPLDREEEICKLSRALALLASSSSVSMEREEFLNMVNKEIELYNIMIKKEGTDGEEEAKRAYKAAREKSDRAAEMAVGNKVSSALVERIAGKLGFIYLEYHEGLSNKEACICVVLGTSIGVSPQANTLKAFDLYPAALNAHWAPGLRRAAAGAADTRALVAGNGQHQWIGSLSAQLGESEFAPHPLGGDREPSVCVGCSVEAESPVDAMLHKLLKEINNVDAVIGDRWQLLDK